MKKTTVVMKSKGNQPKKVIAEKHPQNNVPEMTSLLDAPKPMINSKPKGKIFLMWHLGLGDAIVCNGMVRSLLDRHEVVRIPVKQRNLGSVRFMFRDEPRIEISPANDDVEAEIQARAWLGNGYQTVPIGLHRKGEKFNMGEWDKELYRHADVPFENRWTRFKVVREPERELTVTVPRYCIVYRDLTRGFNINTAKLPKSLHVHELTQVQHVFLWCRAIEGAEEIHAIDGGMLCLIDSLDLSKVKVKMLHRYSRPSTPPTLRDGWVTA